MFVVHSLVEVIEGSSSQVVLTGGWLAPGIKE